MIYFIFNLFACVQVFDGGRNISAYEVNNRLWHDAWDAAPDWFYLEDEWCFGFDPDKEGRTGSVYTYEWYSDTSYSMTDYADYQLQSSDENTLTYVIDDAWEIDVKWSEDFDECLEGHMSIYSATLCECPFW